MSELCVGVTGAGGFIGQHLARRLSNDQRVRVEACLRTAWDDPRALDRFAAGCDVIVHLAGVNRGEDQDIAETNASLLEKLIAAAERCARPPHIFFASSTQRNRENSYGRSKRQCEERLAAWVDGGRRRAATALIIPNVYGPGCRPFYNSVVATFCHQLANGEEPAVADNATIDFVWVNDLVDQIAHAIIQRHSGFGVVDVQKTGTLSVAELLEKLQHFRQSRFDDGIVPNLSDRLDGSLYATFESYFDLAQHSWQPRVHADERGRLFEILKLADGGQVFFSTTRPGAVRGQHYHTRKIEWFCVVEGEAAIRLRRVGADDTREFRVSGSNPQFVSIPVWHIHEIENIGDRDLLTMFWSNEIFNADDPDTYREKAA